MALQYILASAIPIRRISLSRRVILPSQLFSRVLPHPRNSSHEKVKPTRKLSILKGDTFRASPWAVASRRFFINRKTVCASKLSGAGTTPLRDPIDTMRVAGRSKTFDSPCAYSNVVGVARPVTLFLGGRCSVLCGKVRTKSCPLPIVPC
jgi:hypothetical protein